MEWLQTLLDSSTTPAVTALLLGLLTALSPCPLATNIAAVGYIAKHIDSGRSAFVKGLLYTLGRMLAYTLLGVVLIAVLRSGASVFGIRKFVAVYGEMLLGPVLVVAGLYMLFGSRLNLPSFGFGGSGERIARRGNAGALLLGVLFAMAFCPTSGVFLFRNANSAVGHDADGLLAARALCRGYIAARAGGGVDPGFQRRPDRQGLQRYEDPAEVAQSCRRHNVYGYWSIFLYNILFLRLWK